MTKRRAKILFAGVGCGLCVIAYLRGDYLLGFDVAVAYVAVTIGLLWLFARSRKSDGSWSHGRMGIVVVFSLAAGLLMAYPALFMSDLQHFIDKQAVDRAARAEFAAVFASDHAYRDLSISTSRLKMVNLSVSGSLPTRNDLYQLRSRMIKECPTIRNCWLHWDITLRDTGQHIDSSDNLFDVD